MLHLSGGDLRPPFVRTSWKIFIVISWLWATFDSDKAREGARGLHCLPGLEKLIVVGLVSSAMFFQGNAGVHVVE